MAFQTGPVRQYAASLHANPCFITKRWLCIFILLGAFWPKEHITLGLCFIVFSKLINGKHSGENRYENVYFALLKSFSTKGYQQLLYHNLWNVIRVCVRQGSTHKNASAIMYYPLHEGDSTEHFASPKTYSLSTNLVWHMYFCFCEFNWVCNTANFQNVSHLLWFINSKHNITGTL